MDGWLIAVLAVVFVLLLCVGLLAGLAGRRRLIAREGGAFECSARLRTTTPGSGWVLGVARYSEEELEWFRFFSYALRPRRRFRRSDVRVARSREPDAIEAVALYAGQQILVLEDSTGEEPSYSELAMSSESLTGLMSWLEAGPPGGGTARS